MKNAKRILSLILAVLMVFSTMVFVTSAAETLPTTWWDEKTTATKLSGAGTEENPYLISSEDELAYFAKWLESGALDTATGKVYFKLTKNLDMSAHQWRPIGYTANHEAYATHTLNNAVLDGAGFAINGINLSASKAISGYTYANGCALFTKITGSSVVKNLTVSARVLDPAFSADTATQNRAAAALVATVYDSAMIDNVTVNIDMDVSASSGTCYYGGLAAYSYHPASNGNAAKLNKITVNGDLNITGVENSSTKLWAGGVVGFYRYASADQIFNYANITYTAGYGNDTAVGGILGDSFCGIVGDTIENHGNLNITAHSGGYSHYGGCFGRIPVIRATGKNVKNYGTITVNNSNSVDYTGGVIGTLNSHQDNYLNAITNYGDIIYNKSVIQNLDYIGGIVGQLKGANTFTKIPTAINCLNEGDITINYPAEKPTINTTNAKHLPYIGGIMGFAQYVTVDTCVNKGDITVNNAYYGMRVGGITGNIDGAISASLTSSIKNCINDGDISLSNSPDFTAETLYIGGMTGNFAPEHGKITGCTNNGAMTIRSAYAAMQIGGIAGNSSKATQEINGCVNNGDIISYDKNGSYHRNVGGIVGYFALDKAGSKIVDCTNYGDLTRDQVVGNAYLGGIVATTKNIAFVNVKNYGALTMTTVAEGYATGAIRYVGGIAGYANVSSISGAVNEGEINCSGGANTWKVGGVAGSITAVKLDDATNLGNVTVTNEAKASIYYVGGIVGDVTFGTTWINNSENYGDVTVDVEIVNGTSWLGGIVGFLIGASTMKNDANYGDIYASKTAFHYHGGLVGGLNISGNTDVYDRNDSSTVAEMKDLYNEGSVNGVGSTNNAAYGGIVGRASNDTRRENLPVHDIVNAINIGAVKNGSLSGGIIGYNASSRKMIQETDTVETAMRYTINLRECIALNTNGTYGLIGRVCNAFVNISDCFTDAKDYMTYCNQDTLYTGGTGATINSILYPEHYNQGTFKLNPTGITYVEIETMDKASVRLDAFGTDESGIRFDSAISKQTYDALKAAQDAGKLTFEFGTLIAPTDNLNLAKVVAQYDKAAALDALTKPGSKMYTLVPYNQDFLSEDADNYYFAGALNHIKEKNYNLKFTAIAYLTVAVGDMEFTFWAADENMRRVQKETATALKALGYDVYHFNMGEYTRINLINEGAAACPGHTVTDDYREEETAIHSDYYNINTGTQRNEGTHPNYRGYNKMADGVYEVVLYVLKDGAKPALMIDIQ